MLASKQLHEANGATDSLGNILGKIRDVKVGRRLIAFGLETGVERLLLIEASAKIPAEIQEGSDGGAYLGKSNFVAEAMEAADAHFGVGNVVELGKAKAETR